MKWANTRMTIAPIKSVCSLIKNYTWLVFSHFTRRSLVIDPSWDFVKLEACLEKNRLSLEAILLTHGHTDHIFSAKQTSDRYNCPIWIHEYDLEDFQLIWPRQQLLPPTAWEIAGMMVEPIFTPGHTRGSVCYRIEDHLFTGDTLFIEGCGMCFDEHSSPYDLYESLQTIKASCQPSTRIYPAHSYGINPGCSFETVMENNIYLHFTEREEFTEYRMRKRINYFNFK